MLKRLTTRVGERGLDAALTAHRGSAPPVRHATAEQHARPGKGQQMVPTETGPWDLVVPRARHGRSRGRCPVRRPLGCQVPRQQSALAGRLGAVDGGLG